METLAYGLQFDRVVLLLLDSSKKNLRGRMLLGQSQGIDPKTICRPVGSEAGPHAADSRAFATGRAVFQGDPVIADGWPFTVIPIGFGSHAIGVIYADRVNSDVLELEARQQAAIGVLAELLDRSILIHTR